MMGRAAWVLIGASLSLAEPALAQTITNYEEPSRYGRTLDTSPQPRPYFYQPYTHPETVTPTSYDRFGRPRIVVTPRDRLIRECVDQLVIERRPSGDTAVPRMQCRWAVR